MRCKLGIHDDHATTKPLAVRNEWGRADTYCGAKCSRCGRVTLKAVVVAGSWNVIYSWDEAMKEAKDDRASV